MDLFFSPYGTGQNASIYGSDNEQNYYQLEYQLVPALRESRNLLYEEVPSNTSLAVGDLVFLNTGSVDGKFEPIDSNLYGDSFDYIEERKTTERLNIGSLEEEQGLGPSYQSGLTETQIEPEQVSANESSGNGYSYFASGEKYLAVPQGGYNGVEQPFNIFSAGESRSTYFENIREDQNYQADPTNVHRILESRSFDLDLDQYVYGKEREVRIKETSICKGDSASELSDQGVVREHNYLLDSEYNTRTEVKRNASILNIDSLDGSISWDNQKSNQEEFERKLNLFFEKKYVASLTVLATGQEQNIEFLSQYMEDDKVYYLERDIYIDSDLRTQANDDAPVFFSSERGSEMHPFSNSPNTRNPDAVGEEKLYVTQVYHKQNAKGGSVGGGFPFGDYSYYNSQPTVKEEFVYSNHVSSIVNDFEVINNQAANIYNPASYSCEIKGITQYDSQYDATYDGFSLLGYQGVSLTGVSGSATYNKIAFNSLNDSKLNVSFTPLDTGVYYEVQGRETTKDSWITLSHAVESYKGVDSINLTLNHDTVIGAAIPSTFQIRALEWRKSPVTTDPNNIVARNESPDGLILASNGTDGAAGSSNDMYDESKSEHSIVANEAIDLDLDNSTWPNEDDNSNIYYLNFDASDNENYISVVNNRSLNLQKGDFSFEFWLKGASFTAGKNNNIISKGTDYEIVLAAGPKIQFKAKVDDESKTLLEASIATSSWTHIAVCGIYNKSKEILICKLFINGKQVAVNESDVAYDSLVPYATPTDNLKIGGGLAAKLYQPRIYIGKSNYRSNFAVPTAEFSKEASPLRYKALRYKFRRRVSPLSNWIINRKTLVLYY